MSAWKQLLEVQEIDNKLDRLAHRLGHLPERDARAALDEKLVSLHRAIKTVEAQKHGLIKEQTRLEDEISAVVSKIAHEEEALYKSGADIKVAQALQGEIASLRRRVSSLEDEEIEILEQIEPLDAQLATLASAQEALDRDAASSTVALAEAESSLQAEQDAVLAERASITAGIDSDAVAEYDKARTGPGGVVVAVLVAGVCGACHMKLSAVEIDRIKHLDPEESVRCEDCGIFLVR